MGAEAGLSGMIAAQAGLLVTGTAGARGSEALAAALAACAADERRTALLIEAGTARQRRPTLLASPAARDCEACLGGIGAAAARGLVCHLVTGPGEEGLALGAEALARMPEPCPWVLHAECEHWQGALGHPRLPAAAAVVRAELPRDRPLASLAVRDLRRRGLRVKVATRPLGWAAGRRALAGIRPGGADEARLRRWLGLLLGAAV
jgi:hypothetical protein